MHVKSLLSSVLASLSPPRSYFPLLLRNPKEKKKPYTNCVHIKNKPSPINKLRILNKHVRYYLSAQFPFKQMGTCTIVCSRSCCSSIPLHWLRSISTSTDKNMMKHSIISHRERTSQSDTFAAGMESMWWLDSDLCISPPVDECRESEVAASTE